MHTFTHSSKSRAQTKGPLIRWASFYDSFVNLMAFGQSVSFLPAEQPAERCRMISFVRAIEPTLSKAKYGVCHETTR